MSEINLFIFSLMVWWEKFKPSSIYTFLLPTFCLEDIFIRPSRYYQIYLQVAARLTYISFYFVFMSFFISNLWYSPFLILFAIFTKSATSNLRFHRSVAIKEEREKGINKTKQDPRFYQRYVVGSGIVRELFYGIALIYMGREDYSRSLLALFIQIMFGFLSTELMYLREKSIHNGLNSKSQAPNYKQCQNSNNQNSKQKV